VRQNRDAVKLIEELIHNASVANQTLERRLADLSIWFYQNIDGIPRDNLAARQSFLEKAFWILVEINALQVERIHELESRGKARGLWTAKGLSIEGDIRKFG
jgi:hypothetical protein